MMADQNEKGWPHRGRRIKPTRTVRIMPGAIHHVPGILPSFNSFSFLEDEKEDIYTEQDGIPMMEA